jgi:hypothetical protein
MDRTLRRLCKPGDVIEIRALHATSPNVRNATIAGYFDSDHLTDGARAAASLKASGIYVTLNPVKRALLGRANNRLVERPDSTTSDTDIVCRFWLLLDFDPKRPAGISGTQEEKTRAQQMAEECRDYLAGLGWVPPVVADSGNGIHLLYPIDLPNDAESRELIARVLKELSLGFSDDGVSLDTQVFNSARIVKLYGTVAAKGDDTDERPHRLSRILEDPALRGGEVVTREQLEALVPQAKTTKNGADSGRERQSSHDEIAEIEDALTNIDPSPREYWLCVGKALNDYLAEAGRPLWDDWSRRSDKFDERDQNRTWRTFKPGGGIGIGSLFKLARDAGWRPKSHAFKRAAGEQDKDEAGDSEDDAARIKEPPRPLFREIPPGDEFPIDALGELGSAAARDLQRATQAHSAICAQSILAAMNLVTMGHVNIQLPHGETKPISEYFVTIAESGERKTSADSRATAGVVEFQNEHADQYRIEYFEYENALQIWEKARAEILKMKPPGAYREASVNETREFRMGNLSELGDRPEPPTTNTILIGADPTYEGMYRFYSEGGAVIAGQFTSEGGAFVGGHSMNENARLRTATGLSTIWDGAPLTRVRAGERHSVLRGRRLSMHLLIQPRIAQKLYSDPDLADQGLLTRMLPVMPEPTGGTRPFMRPQECSSLSRCSSQAKALLGKPFTYINPERPGEGLCPKTLLLDDAATRLWIAYHNDVDSQLVPGGDWHPIKGLARKAPEHAARLAATIAYFHNDDIEVITAEYMKAGITLMDYYLAEAVRIREGMAINEDLSIAEDLRKWLLTVWEEENDLISLRHIYQLGPYAIRDKSSAERIVAILVDHGWLEPHDPCVVKGEPRRKVWRIIRGESQ